MQTLEELHPMTILLYFLLITGVTMFCANPVLLLLSLLGAVSYFLIRNGKKHGTYHLMSWILFLILSGINPLVSHNGITVLFVLNDNPVTLEALLYGINSAVMILAVLYWLNSFSQIMTSEKILCIFGTVSPKIALLLSMTLRFVPLLNRQSRKVSDAQKALGYYQSDNIIDSIREKMRVMDIVITWALENGIITANSMEARGSGIGRRTNFSVHRMRHEDRIVILISILLFSVTAAAVVRHSLDFVFYPAISSAEYSAWSAAGTASYAVLAFLPGILQAEAALRWKYLRSKI